MLARTNKTIVLNILLILHIGCHDKPIMKEQQQSIIESYVKAYNNFDIQSMTKDLAEDVIFENISNGKVDLRTEGKEAFRKQAEAAKNYFKERKQTIVSWTFSKAIVVIEIDYKAVLAIDLPNGMKAGDTLKLKGTSEFEFEDHQIKQIRDSS